MISRLQRDPGFYIKRYPVLSLQGWEDVAHSYGMINWHLRLTSLEDGNLSARFYVVTHPQGAKVCLEVRHKFGGLATIELGDETLTPQEMLSKGEAKWHELIEKVMQQHQEWLEKIESRRKIHEKRKAAL